MKKQLKSILKYNLLILRLWLVAQRLSPAILHHPIRCIVPDKRSKRRKKVHRTWYKECNYHTCVNAYWHSCARFKLIFCFQNEVIEQHKLSIVTKKSYSNQKLDQCYEWICQWYSNCPLSSTSGGFSQDWREGGGSFDKHVFFLTTCGPGSHHFVHISWKDL